MKDQKLKIIFNEMLEVGISPDTQRTFYVETKERKLVTAFSKAQEVAKLFGQGLRLPTEKELLLIMKDEELKSTFDEGRQYMTSEKEGNEIWVVKPEVAHSYKKPLNGKYRFRFVCDKPFKSFNPF